MLWYLPRDAGFRDQKAPESCCIRQSQMKMRPRITPELKIPPYPYLLHKVCYGVLKVCLQFSEAKWISFAETPELMIWDAQGI